MTHNSHGWKMNHKSHKQRTQRFFQSQFEQFKACFSFVSGFKSNNRLSVTPSTPTQSWINAYQMSLNKGERHTAPSFFYKQTNGSSNSKSTHIWRPDRMWITVRHLPFMQVTHIHLNTPVCSKTRGYHVEIVKLQEYFLPFWVFLSDAEG